MKKAAGNEGPVARCPLGKSLAHWVPACLPQPGLEGVGGPLSLKTCGLRPVQSPRPDYRRAGRGRPHHRTRGHKGHGYVHHATSVPNVTTVTGPVLKQALPKFHLDFRNLKLRLSLWGVPPKSCLMDRELIHGPYRSPQTPPKTLSPRGVKPASEGYINPASQ